MRGVTWGQKGSAGVKTQGAKDRPTMLWELSCHSRRGTMAQALQHVGFSRQCLALLLWGTPRGQPPPLCASRPVTNTSGPAVCQGRTWRRGSLGGPSWAPPEGRQLRPTWQGEGWGRGQGQGGLQGQQGQS